MVGVLLNGSLRHYFAHVLDIFFIVAVAGIRISDVRHAFGSMLCLLLVWVLVWVLLQDSDDFAAADSNVKALPERTEHRADLS